MTQKKAKISYLAMAKKKISEEKVEKVKAGKPSVVVDTRVVYCGDNLDQLAKLPGECVDLVYIDPPFNSNRNYEVFWGRRRTGRCGG
jgi:16S rRNA G966 N2-methylase RsmD